MNKAFEVKTPEPFPVQSFTDSKQAVEMLIELYDRAIHFLSENFILFAKGELAPARIQAYYPEVRLSVNSHIRVDSRLSFGHVASPGEYSTTITQPGLFRHYLRAQIKLLIETHEIPITVGYSKNPIPIHFALPHSQSVFENLSEERMLYLRDYFDVPLLKDMHDDIINKDDWRYEDGSRPLANFTATRIDYSLARLAHYTATDPAHFQNFILFTNYQFYVDEFERYAIEAVDDPKSGYTTFVVPGNRYYEDGVWHDVPFDRTPQMPAYHLKHKKNDGITLVNIGIGPSNAKTITDHIAVLRPKVWLMVGHCAGLRNSQRLGDYVLAHAYMRDDRVLDFDLPPWVPIPALAEVQTALENAVADVTQLEGYELKRLMRTGTVATVDNRNWELREMSGPVRRLNQARAIALDMESATIAANGFRFRIPYGTLLCVSDKPLHGELKLPGMASNFYRKQVSQHLKVGIRAMESLRAMPAARLHSRKLRSFGETAFL